MPDTYELGSIPPISVWEGQTVKFSVRRNSGAADFVMDVKPAPKGRIAIDKLKGDFSYTPAAEDRDELTISLQAGDGRLDKQTFTITPQPRLASDFTTIEHVSQPPDPASRIYTNFAEVAAGKLIFNNTTDFDKEADAQIETKHVTVSGVRLVFEQSNDAGSLYKRINGRTDLRELTICADEVIFRTELNVPGTDVAIYARSLKFERGGRINTTPLSVKTTAQKRDVGLRGQNAGNVYLLAHKTEVQSDGPCVIMNGGDGQPARLGRKGKDGVSKAEWDGRYYAKAGVEALGKWFDVSGTIREKGRGHKAVSAEIWRQAGLSKEYKEQTIVGSAVKNDLDATKEVPTNGTGPDPYPGRPGHGGDGGRMFTNVPAGLRIEWKAGKPGKMADNIEGTKAGEPRKWCVMKCQYHANTVDPDIFATFVMLSGETYDGPGAVAPGVNPDTPNAKDGLMTGVESYTWGWLHPAMARAFIPYAHDLMLAGHTKDLVDLLKLYRDTAAEVVHRGGFVYKDNPANQQDKFLTSTLEDELSALIRRVEGPYDYFGNPAGWVPMLSFQANKTLFENELGDSIKAMFLAHWIEHTQLRQQKAAAALDKAITTLRTECDEALEDYAAAQLQVDDLQSRVNQITNELHLAQQALEATESRTKQQIQNDAKIEHILRSSGKILGGILQLIPVGQPVAGAFGKSFTALADIDLEHPKDSAGKVLGPLAKVAGQKFADKAKKVFSELKSAKEKEETEEQKEFNKAVAEERLEKKVEQFLEEEKEAQDQIIKALSDFAVPEEEIEERLEKILADCPAYKKDIEEIKRLNKKKALFTEELLAALQTIEDATTTLVKNQLALIKLRSQLDVALAGLNVEALQAVRGMGQRARDRLLLYQYYLVKSYQYLMLEDLPLIDYRCQKLFDSFVSVLTKNSGRDVTLNPLAESTDGMLNDKQFEAVSTVFKNQLRDIAAKIIDWYQKHPPRRTGTLPVSLTNEQVEILNAQGHYELDLLPRLDRQREDIRITSVETDSVKLSSPLPAKTVGFSLTYRHDGVSKIRSGGLLYLFRSGQYRVTGDGEASADQYRNDKIHWASDIKYNATEEKESKRLSITETQVDKEEQSLVWQLISGNQDEKNPLVSFRPSAWTRLLITRSGEYDGKISDLTLKINFVGHLLHDRLRTVVVRGSDEIQPLIRCTPNDVNECGDGYGSFVRTFDSLVHNPVTLKAPARYGQRSFVGWRMGTSGGVASSDPTLILKLDKKDYLIEPVYSALEFVPTNQANEKWPPCPVGWKFFDWLLVNSSKVPFTITRLAWEPLHKTFPDGISPTVNEPQGSEHIQLSFERLMLTPGESAKVSVCINPTAPDDAEIGFGWNLENLHYAVFAKARFGDLSMTRKRTIGQGGWSGTDEMFDVDIANRTLTFRA
ncbi:MAG TPA: hypothetical protein VI306_06965 [Pyrinomonadaceae bacterium]